MHCRLMLAQTTVNRIGPLRRSKVSVACAYKVLPFASCPNTLDRSTGYLFPSLRRELSSAVLLTLPSPRLLTSIGTRLFSHMLGSTSPSWPTSRAEEMRERLGIYALGSP
jgi:hypothetical protein